MIKYSRHGLMKTLAQVFLGSYPCYPLLEQVITDVRINHTTTIHLDGQLPINHPLVKISLQTSTYIWPQTTVVLPICSIETCMHIINLCRSITNQTNLVSKIHFERDRISFFKQHVARLPLPPLNVKVQVYEYHRNIATTIREKLCKPTLTMHILSYTIHQHAQGFPISCSL